MKVTLLVVFVLCGVLLMAECEKLTEEEKRLLMKDYEKGINFLENIVFCSFVLFER